MSANPAPVSARPAQYGGRPVSAPAGPYPPMQQPAPASAPPGYGQQGYGGQPGGYGPPSGPPGHPGPGVFTPQPRYPGDGAGPAQQGGENPRGKKKKRSLWDAFMGDLGKNGKNKRDRDESSRDVDQQPERHRSSGQGSSGPLGAYGSLDNRLDSSAAVLQQRVPGFRVEDGVVVPDDARLKKARRRGPGMGGGRWQRFAFLVAMLAAMALLMVLGVSRLISGALVADSTASSESDFPREAASGYVERLNKVFFTWDAENPQTRQQLLDVYFPYSEDSLYGWNSEGKQEVRDLPVTLRLDVSAPGADVDDDVAAVATVTVGMNVVTDPGTPTEQPNFVCTATSVVAKKDDSLAIDSYPAPVACPVAADANVAVTDVEPDTENQEDIQAQLERFFTAYAASDRGGLSNLTTGERITDGLAGSRQFGEIVSLQVPLPAEGADPDVRETRVSVRWLQPGGTGGGSISEYRVTVRLDGVWRIAKLTPALPSAELQPELDAEEREDQRNASTPEPGANNNRPPNTDTQPGAPATGGGP